MFPTIVVLFLFFTDGPECFTAETATGRKKRLLCKILFGCFYMKVTWHEINSVLQIYIYKIQNFVAISNMAHFNNRLISFAVFQISLPEKRGLQMLK